METEKTKLSGQAMLGALMLTPVMQTLNRISKNVHSEKPNESLLEEDITEIYKQMDIAVKLYKEVIVTKEEKNG